jgi:hypothetical protein
LLETLSDGICELDVFAAASVVLELDTLSDEITVIEAEPVEILAATTLEFIENVADRIALELNVDVTDESVLELSMDEVDKSVLEVGMDVEDRRVLELTVDVADINVLEFSVGVTDRSVLELIVGVADRNVLDCRADGKEERTALDDTIGAGTILPPHTPVFLFGAPTEDFR